MGEVAHAVTSTLKILRQKDHPQAEGYRENQSGSGHHQKQVQRPASRVDRQKGANASSYERCQEDRHGSADRAGRYLHPLRRGVSIGRAHLQASVQALLQKRTSLCLSTTVRHGAGPRCACSDRLLPLPVAPP